MACAAPQAKGRDDDHNDDHCDEVEVKYDVLVLLVGIRRPD